MSIFLTDHAIERLRQRRIDRAWVEQVVTDPALIEPDPYDPTLEHRLAVVPAAGHKLLRVVCDCGPAPVRIIMAFFDLESRHKL